VAKKKEVTEATQPAHEEPEAVEIDMASGIEEEAPVASTEATESAEEADTPVVREAEALGVEEVGAGETTSVAEELDRDQEVEPEEPVPPLEIKLSTYGRMGRSSEDCSQRATV